MTALQLPCIMFRSRKRMDDYGASDMHCGDLTENQLKREFHLTDVSTRVDPYTLLPITPFNQPHSMFYGARAAGEKMTVQECARILFDEFRHLSQAFALYGPYKNLIEEMISHMQENSDFPFENLYLNSALKQQIMRDNSENSTLKRIKYTLNEHINWNDKYYPKNKKYKFPEAILKARLPKFDRLQDSFNGLGISVHDTWATHITLQSLHVEDNRYRARVRYQLQDHFGLDCQDIKNFTFNQFRLFRIWFVLQRYQRFAFKPFMTNINVCIDITGERNDHKKQ